MARLTDIQQDADLMVENPTYDDSRSADEMASIAAGMPQTAVQTVPGVSAQPQVQPFSGVSSQPQAQPHSGVSAQPRQDEEAPLLSSFSDAYQQAQARAQEAERRRQETRDRIAQQRQHNVNLRLSILERARPVRDTDKEKNIRTMAKIQALGNFIAALGSGIVGETTKGWSPKTGNDYPFHALKQLDDMERDYLSRDREFRNMEIRQALAEQDADERQLAAELAAADKEAADYWKYLNDLDKSRLNAQQKRDLEKMKQDAAKAAQDAKHKQALDVEKLRGQNSARAASIRSSRPSSSGQDKRYAFLESDGKTEKVLSDAEANYYYELGVGLGIIPEEGSKITYTTTNKDGMRAGKESTRESSYVFDRQSKADRTRMLKLAYEAQILLDNGWPEEKVRAYISSK